MRSKSTLSGALPPAFRGERIRELSRLLEQDPDAVEARFERAGLLRERGAFEAAKRDYLEVLRQRPTDFAALNDFGALVLKAGFRGAARTLFSAAVEHHRDNPRGHVNLANLLLLIGELDQASTHFEAALRIDPDHIHAHRGMSNLLAEIGDEAGASQHRDQGFRNHALTTLPYRGEQAPVSVLLLVSAVGGNTPTDSFLDDRYFRTTVLVTEYYDPKLPLPPHDLVFNSIGDSDLCREGLEAACSIVARTGRPVINHPQAVLKTGRVANAARLRGLPDIIVPGMMTLPRRALADAGGVEAVAGSGFSYPLLVRAPGFHTGRHFVRVETPERLAAAIAELPGEDVWLIEHLDARDNEGMFRKFRVMIVDGQLYPLHLAISQDWKVHYFTADMAHSAENRSKDAAFLEDMTSAVGRRGIAALERIGKMLGLDYGGIDFAVNAQGEIVFFEANATMVVVPLSLDEKWDYRRPAVDRIFAAVRAMLVERSIGSSAAGGRASSGKLAQ